MTRLGLLLAMLIPAIASADPEVPVVDKSAEKPEDAQLYHCDKKIGQVNITFKPETELKDLVAWAMGFTCRNFMYEPGLAQRVKKVTIIAPNSMSPQDAYKVFVAALSTMGLTVVQSGQVMRIVESPTARTEALPLVTGMPAGEQIVRVVVKPTYAQVATMAAAINAMKSTAGDVQTIGNTLLVTDYGGHVRNMLDVVKQIDVPGGTDGLYTIPVLHADADKLGKELESMLQMTAQPVDKNAAPVPQPKLIIDQRTNTLIVAGSEAAYNRVRSLVAAIDIPVETETGGSMHIYPLKAAIAEEVATVLNTAISGAQKPAAATAGKPGQQPTPQQQASPVDSLHLEGDVKITADKATNKLIVMSSGRDYIALRNVIQELDEPRKQVYIEATILEVTLQNETDFGTSEHTTYSTDNGTVVVGGVQTGTLSSTNVSSLGSLTGLIGGVVGSAITGNSLLGTSFPSYGLVFQALSTSSNAKVLSAPSMIALDNEETKYQVGTNVPYSRGTLPVSSTNPSTSLVTTNIDRMDLNLELDIKPHISAGDEVMLEIKHTNKDLTPNANALGPEWTDRTIETRVVVKDQATVVIGGLMQEKVNSSKTSVPILGDIPVLGRLFSYTTKQKVKTNLLVLITPYIIRDQLDLQQIREKRQREQNEFLSSMKALSTMKLDRSVDYARKRGLIEEINRSVQSVEDEARDRASVVHVPQVPQGPLLH
ncbi:MAG: type II secretion system secretin GspD [Kofleriaceae bacterium]